MVRYSRKAMHEVLAKLFDYIFPPHEENLRVRKLTEITVSTLYAPSITANRCVLSRYEDKNVRALIHEAKFQGNKRAFMLLNILFTMYLDTQTKATDVIIPIPLSSARMRARGYNQVTEILRARDSHFSGKINDTVLKRNRDTKPQTELGREQRLENVRDAFRVMTPETITGKHVLLVDDVTTTGATLSTAKAALLPYSPASVTSLALAH